ncbi:MAG: DegV family protein [Sedimentibacter sp.]|uniref:DegV family protein n=1 Tax=Sedimentibacter sp. TaxID=1960295 RepID=UPI0031594973
MRNYVIFTESTADLPINLIEELDIKVIPMVFGFENESYLDYPDHRELDINKFYERLKNGERSTTALINAMTFQEYFEPELKNGNDILYLGFSSGLSGTYQSSLIAAQELREKYPDSVIKCVDTKAANIGQGLLVYSAAQKKKEGLTLDQAESFVLEKVPHTCHWFTVDDLNHLKRGGRISAVKATVGTALNVKPILHVDDEGLLKPVDSVRGRKKSINALLDKMTETCVDPQEQTIFIGHCNCLEDAEYLAKLVRESFDVKEVIINDIGPIVGSHLGQGGLTLFFFGTKR